MKNIKKTVALSLVTISFLSFSIHAEPVKAQNFLTRLLFPREPLEKRDIDRLYGRAPDYDSLYGQEPPQAKNYSPNGPSPYGRYGNKLENIMGRDIKEILELNKRYNKRIPGYGGPDRKTFFRAAGMLPHGELKKIVQLEDGNIAYMFYDWDSGRNGTPGTPDKTESITVMNPSTGVGGVYTYTVPGTSTPGTAPSDPWNCTTYLIADPNGKLFYWSYKGSSSGIDECSSDIRRLK